MMKKLILILAILLAPSLAWAQCNGVFPAYTYCGTAASPNVPSPVAGSTSILGPVPANTIIANVTNSSAVPLPWAIGASSSVEGTGVPGLDGTQFFIYNAPVTSATAQDMTLRVDRNASYTGGTSGNVYNAIWALSTVGANVTNYEWAILGELNNSATAGQNVAVAGYANVLTTATSITWGGAFTLDDNTNTANPAAGRVGMEIDNYGNGTDTNTQRIILDLVGGKHGLAGTTPTITWGWRVGAQNGTLANATFVHGGYFNPATYTDLIASNSGIAATNGIDFSAGTFSGSPFKSTGFSVNSTGSVIIAAGQNLVLNGTTNIDGTFTTGSTTPVLTANKPGSTTSIGTWLKVVVNSVTFWVPAWAN